MAWDVQFKRGVYLPQIDWWLDAQLPKPRSFVSHAHFDHLARHQEVLCTRATSRLMRARLAGRRMMHALPFGRAEPLTPDTVVTLFPAGHMLGSAQFHVTHPEHGSLLYTGDFKLRPALSVEPCATPRADVLIMETTFGRPQYVMPPTEQVAADLLRFCGEALADHTTPVLYCYSLGKSQELLATIGGTYPVMLHAETFRLTTICAQLGQALPPFQEFDAAALAGRVVICPAQGRDSAFLKNIPRRRTAVITGWAIDPATRFRSQCDAAFPLSDHADFPDLLRFVELVRPKRVLTLHGFAAEFAATLRARGVEAWALGVPNQLDLPLAD